MKKLIAATLAALALVFGLSACTDDDADVVSKNLSKDADNFKIERQIVFYNGVTGEYIAEVTGLCSVDGKSQSLSVTCKVGKDKYIKNFLGLSDNVTWFALQTSSASVSDSRYKVVFKPSTVIPDFDAR
jgi:protein involved in sex pheromone biosynthesis